jgi:hypothetical protein
VSILSAGAPDHPFPNPHYATDGGESRAEELCKKGRLELVTIGDATIGRAVFEPRARPADPRATLTPHWRIALTARGGLGILLRWLGPWRPAHLAPDLTRGGGSATGSTCPSITLADSARAASIAWIASIPRSNSSSLIALTPPVCSTFISRGTRSTSSFRKTAGWFFITLLMALRNAKMETKAKRIGENHQPLTASG